MVKGTKGEKNTGKIKRTTPAAITFICTRDDVGSNDNGGKNYVILSNLLFTNRDQQEDC